MNRFLIEFFLNYIYFQWNEFFQLKLSVFFFDRKELLLLLSLLLLLLLLILSIFLLHKFFTHVIKRTLQSFHVTDANVVISSVFVIISNLNTVVLLIPELKGE